MCSLGAVALVAPMIAYASSYLFSSWPDYRTHIAASLPRLLLQLLPLGWLIIAATFRAQDRQSRFLLPDDEMNDAVRRRHEEGVEVFT